MEPAPRIDGNGKRHFTILAEGERTIAEGQPLGAIHGWEAASPAAPIIAELQLVAREGGVIQITGPIADPILCKRVLQGAIEIIERTFPTTFPQN
jgi:hypothetical protein